MPRGEMTGSKPVEERLCLFLEKTGLLGGIGRLGVAVSGGADSVALLFLLRGLCLENGVDLSVISFDHAIEGENSLEEAKFVRNLASSLGMKCISGRADPPVAASKGKSIEMAAREARMAFFREVATCEKLDAIATGHQKDDLAETLLLRLMRGSGSGGLSAIKPVSTGEGTLKIVRPLLEFTKEELKEYLLGRGISWMEDVSNSNKAIPRNRIRHSVLPCLAGEFGIEYSSLLSSASKSSEILRAEDEFLSLETEKWFCGHGGVHSPLDIASARLLHKAISRRIVRDWLCACRLSDIAGFDLVESILAGQGGRMSIGKNLFAAERDGALYIEKAPTEIKIPPQTDLEIGRTVKWGEYLLKAEAGAADAPKTGENGNWPKTASFCLPECGKKLSVRARKPGDRIKPCGMRGSQKLQDVFVNAKLPRHLRDGYPLVFFGDELLWVPGLRLSRTCRNAKGIPVKITVSKENGQ